MHLKRASEQHDLLPNIGKINDTVRRGDQVEQSIGLEAILYHIKHI